LFTIEYHRIFQKEYFYLIKVIYLIVLTPYFYPINQSKMSVLFILIIVSLTVAASFLVAFIWSVKNGQYEDGYTPSVRMLFDDELKQESKKHQIKNKSIK